MAKKQKLVALIIGCILIIPNVYWIVLAESMGDSFMHMTMQSIFFNVVFTLFVLIALNIFLKRFSVRLTLSSQELIVVYIMVNIASAIAGHGTMQVLIPLIVHPFWYATPENDWANLFHDFIPSWLSVRNMSVLQDFYKGSSSFYTLENVRAWTIPILTWSGFIFVFVFVMLCINSILRKRWTETEKLSYPMVQLPFSMSVKKAKFFSNRILWLGFAIPAFINIINGLHYIYPSVPYINVKLHDIGRYFTERPWNAIGWIPVSFYPFIIGLGFFIPVDLCFSLWFFFLFWKGQSVLWQSIGLPSSFASGVGGMHSSEVQQASGALIGICVVSLWSGRKYLKDVFLRILSRQDHHKTKSQELMSYRSAFLGLILGSLFILYFCYVAGIIAQVTIYIR